MFLRPAHIYVKLSTNKVWAKHLESQTVVESDAHEFTTERLLIGNFDIALSVTKAVTRQAYSARVKWSPNIAIHPLEYLEGGLSPVEKQLFLELAACIGAREARVWEGTELADVQVVKLFRLKKSDRL